MFRKKKTTDLLNEAHTLGLGAISAFEKAADDAEQAAQLAERHTTALLQQMAALNAEVGTSSEAAHRYGQVAANLRALVEA